MSRLPDLERSLLRAAERLDREEATAGSVGTPRRGWWSRSRLPLLVTVGTLALGGGAVAANQLLATGDPVPDAHAPGAGGGPDVRPDARPRVLSVRVPDPDGGPPWGLGTFTSGNGRRTFVCVSPGRVQDDTLGVVGRDGVFGDDGRFHALRPRSSASSTCGNAGPSGLPRYRAGDGPSIPASGYTGAPGPPVGGCREDVPASTMSRQTRRRLRDVPVCRASGQRIVKFGFSGPEAVKVTYGNDRVLRTLVPKPGEGGAYLFVLRPRDARGSELVLTETFRDGTVCTSTRSSPPSGPGCSPPPGVLDPPAGSGR